MYSVQLVRRGQVWTYSAVYADRKNALLAAKKTAAILGLSRRMFRVVGV